MSSSLTVRAACCTAPTPTRPNPPQSHCTDACAQTWLPLTVPAGQEPQLLGVDEAAVGRLARPDGSSQLTLGGWPVYVNRSDDGQLKQAGPGLQSQGWFAMSPAGDEGRAARLTVRRLVVPPERTSRRRWATAYRYRASHHPISGFPIR